MDNSQEIQERMIEWWNNERTKDMIIKTNYWKIEKAIKQKV